VIENKALLIFVKNAIEGKVKTRLAKDIGDAKALEAYQLLSYHTKDVSKKIKAKKYVYYSDNIEDQDLWPNKGFHKMAQFGKDLGERMLSAFQFTLNSHERVVLIGSDCPMIKKVHLKLAYDALAKNEVVLGPAKDGGYYLIGMTKVYAALFEDIDWSTANVLDQTIAKLEKSKISYKLLEVLEDVDTIKEWNHYKGKLEHTYKHLLDRKNSISNKNEKMSSASSGGKTEKASEGFIIYEDKIAKVILAQNSINKGHVIIVPKGKYLDIDEISHKVLQKILFLAKQHVKLLKKKYKAPGYSIMQNGGAFNEAGQFQLHVFPRYNTEDFAWTYNGKTEPNAAEYKDLAVQFKSDYIQLIPKQ